MGFVRYQAAATMVEGAPPATEGSWSHTGGTGGLKGIKGIGTYRGMVNPDGTTIYEVKGEYQLPKQDGAP